MSLAKLLAAASVNANTTSDALKACQKIQSVYPNQIIYSDTGLDLEKDHKYDEATPRYWSQATADNKPACVFLPESADMTAFTVQVLNTYTTVPWAVKGAGHNPNVGFSSTAGGMLLAMENMANTTLDGNGLAHVGPGARWGDVSSTLNIQGRAVVGGRLSKSKLSSSLKKTTYCAIGDVGVAGYTVGGDLSYFSTEHVGKSFSSHTL